MFLEHPSWQLPSPLLSYSHQALHIRRQVIEGALATQNGALLNRPFFERPPLDAVGCIAWLPLAFDRFHANLKLIASLSASHSLFLGNQMPG